MTARLPEAPDEGPTAELMRARRGGRLSTLDRLLLHSPPVAEGWNALLGALRTGTTLPDDLRELVILRVAVLNDAAFEWTAHEPIARRAGLTDGQLRALRSPVDEPVWSPAQAAVLAFTDASTRAVAVPDAVFAAVQEHLDRRQVVELCALVAGYAMGVALPRRAARTRAGRRGRRLIFAAPSPDRGTWTGHDVSRWTTASVTDEAPTTGGEPMRSEPPSPSPEVLPA
jgi:AhpD family alkylhydroperoxidase